jgi:type I restriction enzyme, S subunit
MNGWPTLRLADVAELNPSRPRQLLNLDHSCEVTFVPMPAVNQHKGVIAGAQTRPFGEVKKGFTYFADGDVIFAKITPCMQNGKSAVASGLMNGLGFGSTEFHVIRPNVDKLLPEWIWHFVRQRWFRYEGVRHFQGAVGQQRVPADYLGNTSIPVPPVAEQRRIIGRIQEYMERVEEIESLRKSADDESAQLLRAFYRDVYLELVSNSTCIPLSQAATVTGGGTPSKNNPTFWGGTIPWVSPKDMKVRDLFGSFDRISVEAIQASAAKLIDNPAVLFVVRGMILAHTVPVAVSRVPLTINQDMKALTPKVNFDVDFLATMIRGAEVDLLKLIEVAGHGTRRLQTEHWASLPVPLLPLERQREVVARTKAAERLADTMGEVRPTGETHLLRDSILRKAFAGEL